jgi:hypothetical protein
MIEKVGVDTVYETIYSDKPMIIKGKEEINFMGYVLKKTGGSNYTCNKYEPAGPKFYTLEDGRTFVNCPLISARTSEYDVPLPPIPFMPKTCHNKE